MTPAPNQVAIDVTKTSTDEAFDVIRTTVVPKLMKWRISTRRNPQFEVISSGVNVITITSLHVRRQMTAIKNMGTI